MSSLFVKDRSWVTSFLCLGNAAMVGVICSGSFAFEFVVPRGDREPLFHVAWALGMVLGVVGACFDEALGMADYVAQRAVSTADLLRARLRACTTVLVGWFLCVPFFAYASLFFFDADWEFGHVRLLPEIWGAMLPAVSACALGLAAGSLPLHGFVRLGVLGTMFALSFSTVFWAAQTGSNGSTTWSTFVFGHASITVVAIGWLVVTAGDARDGDRPWSPRARRSVVVPVTVLATIAGCLVLAALEGHAIERLHRCYPRLVQRDGTVQLAIRPDWERGWIAVDGQHQPTGQEVVGARDFGRWESAINADFLRIEAPRSGALANSQGGAGGRLCLGADGSAWWQSYEGGLLRVAKSEPEPDFVPGSLIVRIGARIEGGVVFGIVEPEGTEVFLLDDARRGFRREPLPDGDKVRGRIYGESDKYEQLADAPVTSADEGLLEGDIFVYALRAGVLRKVGRRIQPRIVGDDFTRIELLRKDGLSQTLVVPGGSGGVAFEHRFEPRTLAERSWAGVALCLSALRPPVVQTIAGCASDDFAETGSPVGWMFAPLVVDGRRWWLVGVAWIVAAAATWRVRQRLRHLGADASTIHFWTIATLLLGLVGALCCMWFERPRMHALRNAPPAPAPRLQTTLVPMESLP